MTPTKTGARPESVAPTAETAAPVTQAPKPPREEVHFSVNIYHTWCKACGICVEFCPKDVLTSDALGTPDPTYPERCIGCTLCVLHCPDFAITVSVKE